MTLIFLDFEMSDFKVPFSISKCIFSKSNRGALGGEQSKGGEQSRWHLVVDKEGGVYTPKKACDLHEGRAIYKNGVYTKEVVYERGVYERVVYVFCPDCSYH